MKQKIINICIALIFFIGFGYFFGDEYWQYQSEKQEYKSYTDELIDSKESFLSSDLAPLEWESQLLHTPNLGLLDRLVSEIDSAQERVYVEVYIFTETQMRDALVRAHSRWVEVKVLLENNPYKAPYLNDKHYRALSEAGVNVKWSDPLNYSLNHAKMMIIDEKAYVSTGNFSYSLFKYNRDFIISLTDPSIIGQLRTLFLRDFEHKIWGVIHENIVISPDNGRDKIHALASSAKESIDFYFPYIADDDFKQLLFDIAYNWVIVRWIVEEKFFKENPDIISEFQDNNISLRYLDDHKLHAKALLSDEKNLYVWSINFSRYSFDENREIGLMLGDSEIISSFRDIFTRDFQ